MTLIASGTKNSIDGVLQFCDRHGLVAIWKHERQHWELVPPPKPAAHVLKLVNPRTDDDERDPGVTTTIAAPQ